VNREKKKKILIISYYFPPNSEVGGIRPAKFAKYLPDFGWEPIILTIKEKHIVHEDPERLSELQDMKILRTSVWPTGTQLIDTVKNKLRNNKINSIPNQKIGNQLAGNKSTLYKYSSRIAMKTKMFLKSIMEMPDEQVGWFFPAVWRGYRAIKNEKIERIFATAPPATSLLVGYVLSKLTGVSLVVDFRDPCFSQIFKDFSYANKYSDAVEHYLGKKIIHFADKIITITDEYRAYLLQYYPGLPKDKLYVVWNGYENKDRPEPLKKKAINEKFVISYIGRFYKGQNPDGFFQAIRHLLNEKLLHEEKISLNFVTSTKIVRGELVKAESIEEMIQKYKLESVTNLFDYLPYQEALIEMSKSNVLLVFSQTKHEYFIIPSKVFEIIGLRKNILCFTTGGATYNFLRNTGGALIADQNNPREIKEAVKTLYNLWVKKEEIPYKVDTTKFERRELTKMFVDILD
jgi:glycosyltransferase involved in cell wall biosynthesis